MPSAARPYKLLAGLAAGVIGGLLLEGAATALLPFVEPVGRLWLDALTMTVVPLVFALLVTGIADASRKAAAGAVTVRALWTASAMLVLACLVAALLAQTLLNFWPVDADILHRAGMPGPPPPAASRWYESIIPANPVKAAADTAMVPLVFFALVLGFALARTEHDVAKTLLGPLRAIREAMLIIVGWVLTAGPIGIAALAFGATARLGASIFGALAQYVVVVVLCCLAAALLAYGWAVLAGRLPLSRFVRLMLPVQIVAFGTQSSLASLPVMVEATGRLGITSHTSGIALPLAVSLFRASSAAANVAVAIYLAHMHGMAIGVGGLVLAALVAVPVSLGAVGLPAQVSFFATIAPVCIALGVPVTLLPLLLAIEAIPDLFRTVGNVTNDVALASVVDRWTPKGRLRPETDLFPASGADDAD